MFLGLTLVFQQRHKLVREDDFYQSQTAETYCDPLKNKNQYHQAMLRDHRQTKDRHTAAEIWAFLMLMFQYYFSSVTPKNPVAVPFLKNATISLITSLEISTVFNHNTELIP